MPSRTQQPKKQETFWGISKNVVVTTIGASYVLYFVICAVALVLVCMGHALLFPYIAVLSITSLHFAFLLFGELFVSFYTPYPIDPMVIYRFADFAMAAAWGATLVTFPNKNRHVAAVANAIVIIGQLFCFRKTFKLLYGAK